MAYTRRAFLKQAALAAGTGVAVSSSDGAAGENPRYRLGCETLPYRSYPLARALEGIRKAGYRYVMPFQTHAGQPAFNPLAPAAGRADLRRQFTDAGLQPFMCFVGLQKELADPAGLKLYLEELDLCAEFGISTVVGVGPWYYDKFPNVPKRARDFNREVDAYFAALQKPVRHAESLGITITLKPHTGVTATANACMQALMRIASDRLQICWDAGNVSFYEGIHPDPDLPDLAPHVKSVCVKDHHGVRAEANFPTPGEGQIDHELMFRTLFRAGFNGPIAVERVDGREDAAKMSADTIDAKIASARKFLVDVLDKTAA
jgi:sugar phosphate isomerase/epimerase